MLVTEKNLKEFRKRLKERHNNLEREVGEVLSCFVGEIKDFGFDLYAQHSVELDGRNTVFDYALKIRHRDREDWVLIELKEYQDPGMLVPHISRFGEGCALFQAKYPECRAYRLFVIDTEEESLPVNLSQEATKHKINLIHFSVVRMLEEQEELKGSGVFSLRVFHTPFTGGRSGMAPLPQS
jgi:hypothetical protein